LRRVHSRGEDIRRFIVEHVGDHSSDIAKFTGDHFKISRQAVNKHLKNLTTEGALASEGNTRNRVYRLAPLAEWWKTYDLRQKLEEHVIWSEDIKPALGMLPGNVMNIWNHGFTEMFNNAIDHSEGTKVTVRIRRTAATSEMLILDDGVGIFKKIQREKNLLDERHALLELSKGKLTTDPRNHAGEGIFFTSRMFDEFQILSAGTYFSHKLDDPSDWLSERAKPEESGTAVFMTLQNHTARTTRKVFDQFTSGEDVGFTKTIVPVRLAQYGQDLLISRSQAKRVLARVELFKTVLFDFKEVESIGQAFADEVFRVFANAHPEIELHAVNANSAVKRMIAHVKAAA
jgi:anti-sigma regulatory factor (Ser/Thr protein kinase)/biotin operon repressor